MGSSKATNRHKYRNVLGVIVNKYESVWAYINGLWKSYDPNQPYFSDLTTITPGVGYWIKTSEACTWSLP